MTPAGRPDGQLDDRNARSASVSAASPGSTPSASARHFGHSACQPASEREVFEAEEWGAKLQEQFSAVSALVPKVYEHRTIGDHFYVAMEYVDGENLSDAIGRGPLPFARAVTIATELARFLDAAHRFEVTLGDRNLRALLHGDLKPKNVRITSDDRVKVLDFGIAKALSMTRRVTRNDFGSIAYLSPERLESGEIDEASDRWALGVLLYEMLTGAPPFRGGDTRRVEQLIKSRQPPAPLDAGCPAALKAIVAKTLAPDLASRYSSATAIVEDLSRFSSGGQTEAEREGWLKYGHDWEQYDMMRPVMHSPIPDDELIEGLLVWGVRAKGDALDVGLLRP